MYRDDYNNAKMAGPGVMGLKDLAQQSSTAQAVCGQERAWSLADEQEKSALYHQDEANKAKMAAAFFRTNPAFEEFIKLIRQGVIQL